MKKLMSQINRYRLEVHGLSEPEINGNVELLKRQLKI
jgi:hypothetical protein